MSFWENAAVSMAVGSYALAWLDRARSRLGPGGSKITAEEACELVNAICERLEIELRVEPTDVKPTDVKPTDVKPTDVEPKRGRGSGG